MGRRNGKSRAHPKLPATVVPLKDLPPAVRAALDACTPLQQAYVMHYCGEARFNGTRAAQLAGITGTYAAQASQSSNWLNELRVRAAIDAWVTAFAWSAAELTARLKDLAEANLGAFLEVDAAGTVRLRTLTAAEWASHKHWLKHVDVDPETGAVTRMEIHDSLAALRELAKVMKLYTDAPQLNLFLHLQRLSDAELLAELDAARGGVGPALLGSGNGPR